MARLHKYRKHAAFKLTLEILLIACFILLGLLVGWELRLMCSDFELLDKEKGFLKHNHNGERKNSSLERVDLCGRMGISKSGPAERPRRWILRFKVTWQCFIWNPSYNPCQLVSEDDQGAFECSTDSFISKHLLLTILLRIDSPNLL
jgi:hypothetical protein